MLKISIKIHLKQNIVKRIGIKKEKLKNIQEIIRSIYGMH